MRITKLASRAWLALVVGGLFLTFGSGYWTGIRQMRKTADSPARTYHVVLDLFHRPVNLNLNVGELGLGVIFMLMLLLALAITLALLAERRKHQLERANGKLQVEIGERQRAQEEVSRLNADLERRVAARTSEFQAANQELEAFCYSVSHDLRAPLRAIDGFGNILLHDYHDGLDEQGRHYLQRIHNATQRMAQLIDDLLSLSRVTRTEMQMDEVNLSAVAQEIVASLQQMDSGRSVEVTVEEGLAARGDPPLLRQVLENLLGNAWKYTSKTPAARIGMGARNHRDGRAVYFVEDNGAGFDMRYSDKLFGVFQRLHSASEFPGTGVGLATVQRIIRRHGGDVWAEGRVGEGATFYFSL
jgi:light-regulated signal transduction histidine kinase (bacteriophytochrome)